MHTHFFFPTYFARLLIVLFFLGFVGLSHAQTKPNFANNPAMLDYALRLKLAEDLVNLNPPLDAMTRDGHPLLQQPVVKQVFTELDPTKINTEATNLMAASFTQAELAALLAFNQSPEGKSINAKMPKFQKILGGLVQQELQNKFKQLQAQGKLQNPESLNQPGFGIFGPTQATPQQNPYSDGIQPSPLLRR